MRYASVPALPPVALTLAVAVAITALLWPHSERDIGIFLVPWFDHIRVSGPVAAFAAPFSNYAPPYLYLLSGTTLLSPWVETVTLVKGLSVAGTIALAGATWQLLRATRGAAAVGTDDGQAPLAGAALVLLLPTVLLNAVVLAQCDAMWSAACLAALAAGMRHRHGAMAAWCGVALGFKLQAVFFGPFVLALLIRRRVPFRLWLIAPVVWFATLLPAWAAGWPIADLMTIYLHQMEYTTAISMNAPNLWALADRLPPLAALPLSGLAFAAAIGTSVAYVAWASSRTFGTRALMEVALLAPLMTVGLLPRMHERYFFLADVLALAIALRWPDRRSVTIALLVQTGSALAVLAYMSDFPGFAAFGAVATIVATISLARPLLRPAANDDPVMSRVPVPA